jgi:serine/threonine-protein kinase
MINQQIGNYKFLSIIGEGGMAVVYLAENVMLNSLRAIKVLKPEFIHNSSIRKRFLEEGEKLEKIQNQHVLKVYDVIEKNDFVV